VFLVLGILFTIFSSTFSVDTGSSAVLKSWSGTVNETPVVEAGFHTKAPWEDVITWDVRNQNVMFTGNGTTTHDGQTVAGAELSFTDKDGVSGNMDIQVVYSIQADKTVELTNDYSNQEAFAVTVVENDVKSLPRDAIAKYSTINVFNQRDQLRTDIAEGLKAAWADKGIILDNINIQGIRYPEDVNQRFKDAQNAQTDLVKADTQAKIDKTAADGAAAAAIAKATGEAEANRLLAQSLTPEVLQQRYIDAIGKAGTIIVPQGFTSLGQIPAAQ
jgi:regulator of protease activity HflC (stomatin/prohibitin superfamily)